MLLTVAKIIRRSENNFEAKIKITVTKLVVVETQKFTSSGAAQFSKWSRKFFWAKGEFWAPKPKTLRKTAPPWVL